MPQCPVCESFQIVVVVSTSRIAWCDRCGARWLQAGSEQRRIVRRLVRGPELPHARPSRVPAYAEPALEGLRA